MNQEPFLPISYSVPSSAGKYYKLLTGANQFRILDSPIMGTEYWNHDGKPVRRRTGDNINLGDIRPDKEGNPGKAKHFWALPVWDGTEVKVLEITQKGIQSAIKDLVQDEDWANPRDYDMVVNRSGEGFETEYSVKPKKPVELSKEAKTAWSQALTNGFNLETLYEGGDPFNPTTPRSAVEVLSDPFPPEEGEVNIDDINF